MKTKMDTLVEENLLFLEEDVLARHAREIARMESELESQEVELAIVTDLIQEEHVKMGGNTGAAPAVLEANFDELRDLYQRLHAVRKLKSTIDDGRIFKVGDGLRLATNLISQSMANYGTYGSR